MKKFLFFAISLTSFLILSNISFLTISAVAQGLPAFPGAVGFGSTTIGGRGGRVIEVTNLNASGPGSFREACEASGPRIVIFRTGGTITLKSNIDIVNPYITIGGQTAPGDGISIRGATIHVMTHDVIIRSLRVRVGDDPTGPNPDNRDGIQISNSRTPVYNVIIDHCSVSWGIDENISIWYSAHDITIQNSISSEGLYNSIHSEGSHSKGALFGDEVSNVTFIGNLLAHNHERNPRFRSTNTIIVNNVVYDRRWMATRIDAGSELQKISIIGNVYKKGPEETFNKSIYIEGVYPGSQIYIDDNDCTTDAMPSSTPCYEEHVNGDPFVNIDPISWPSGLVARSSDGVLQWVLANVGAYPNNRDSVDTRIISDVQNGTGGLIDSQGEVGGWPTLEAGTPPPDKDHDGMPDTWETARGLDPNDSSDGNKDRNGDGYTNVEEYINGLIPMVSNEVPSSPKNLRLITD